MKMPHNVMRSRRRKNGEKMPQAFSHHFSYVSETTYTMHIACHISSWRVICVIQLRTKKSDKNSIAGSEQESEQHPKLRSLSQWLTLSYAD